MRKWKETVVYFSAKCFRIIKKQEGSLKMTTPPNSLFIIVFTSIILALFFVVKTFQIKEERKKRRKDAENKKIIEAWQNLGSEEQKKRKGLLKGKIEIVVKKHPGRILYSTEIIKILSETEEIDEIDKYIIKERKLLLGYKNFKCASVSTKEGETERGYYYNTNY